MILQNMKIRFRTSDNVIIKMSIRFFKFSKTIERLVLSPNFKQHSPIILPNINAKILKLIVKWAAKHKEDYFLIGNIPEDCIISLKVPSWDEEFFKNIAEETLYDVINGASYFEMRGLMVLALKYVSNNIKAAKTMNEILMEYEDIKNKEQKIRKFLIKLVMKKAKYSESDFKKYLAYIEHCWTTRKVHAFKLKLNRNETSASHLKIKQIISNMLRTNFNRIKEKKIKQKKTNKPNANNATQKYCNCDFQRPTIHKSMQGFSNIDLVVSSEHKIIANKNEKIATKEACPVINQRRVDIASSLSYCKPNLMEIFQNDNLENILSHDAAYATENKFSMNSNNSSADIIHVDNSINTTITNEANTNGSNDCAMLLPEESTKKLSIENFKDTVNDISRMHMPFDGLIPIEKTHKSSNANNCGTYAKIFTSADSTHRDEEKIIYAKPAQTSKLETKLPNEAATDAASVCNAEIDLFSETSIFYDADAECSESDICQESVTRNKKTKLIKKLQNANSICFASTLSETFRASERIAEDNTNERELPKVNTNIIDRLKICGNVICAQNSETFKYKYQALPKHTCNDENTFAKNNIEMNASNKNKKSISMKACINLEVNLADVLRNENSNTEAEISKLSQSDSDKDAADKNSYSKNNKGNSKLSNDVVVKLVLDNNSSKAVGYSKTVPKVADKVAEAKIFCTENNNTNCMKACKIPQLDFTNFLLKENTNEEAKTSKLNSTNSDQVAENESAYNEINKTSAKENCKLFADDFVFDKHSNKVVKSSKVLLIDTNTNLTNKKQQAFDAKISKTTFVLEPDAITILTEKLKQ